MARHAEAEISGECDEVFLWIKIRLGQKASFSSDALC
jgi:hypothetical protein